MTSSESKILIFDVSDEEKQFHCEYRNKRHIRVLYDGFKLSSGCIKATKPEGLSALIQQNDSLKPS